MLAGRNRNGWCCLFVLFWFASVVTRGRALLGTFRLVLFGRFRTFLVRVLRGFVGRTFGGFTFLVRFL